MKTILSTLLVLGSVVSTFAADPLDTWTKRHDLPNLEKIVYANGRFLALGTSLSISFDGAKWTNHPAVNTQGLSKPAFGNGMFLAVIGTSAITSPDGVNWVHRQIGTTIPFRAVGFGNGVFLVGNQEGDFWKTTDGTDWTPHDGPTNGPINDIAYSRGQFVAVGGSSIRRSTDAIEWSVSPSPSNQNFRSVIDGGGMWIAVGDGGAIVVSPDGQNWEQIPKFTPDTFTQVIYGNGYFLVCAQSQSGNVWSSPNGRIWITRPIPILIDGGFGSCAFGNNSFVVGSRNTIQQSGFLPSIVSEPSLSIDIYPRIKLQGTIGASYVIERSSDVNGSSGWTEVNRLILQSQNQLSIDENGVGSASRFYRARPSP